MIKIKNKITLFLLIMLSISLVACSKDEEKIDKTEEVNKILLDEGAIVENESGDYINYSLIDSEYSMVENEKNEAVALYDYKSGNYITIENNKYYSIVGNKKKELNNIGIYDSNFNMSPGGKYLLFFRNEEYSQLKIMSLSTGKLVDLKVNVSISGKYIDWLDEKTIVYYGIRDEDKTNAIFTYDLETGKEDVYLKLEEGYIEYIKALDDGVVYSVGNFDGEKKLIRITGESNSSEVLSTDIMKIYDLVEFEDKYYILGNFKNSDYALYCLSNGNYKRITYSFPSRIDLDKGLSFTEYGNILFIGSNKDGGGEEVYQADEDGAVSLVKSSNCEINFVRRNS